MNTLRVTAYVAITSLRIEVISSVDINSVAVLDPYNPKGSTRFVNFH